MRADVRFHLLKEWCQPSTSPDMCWLLQPDGKKFGRHSVDKVTLFLLQDLVLPVLLEHPQYEGRLKESRDHIVEELSNWTLRDPSELGVWPWKLYLTLLSSKTDKRDAELQKDLQEQLAQNWSLLVCAPLDPPDKPKFPEEPKSPAGLAYPKWCDLAKVRKDFVTENRLMAWCYEAQANKIANDATQNSAQAHRDAFLSYMLAYHKFKDQDPTDDELCPHKHANSCWASAKTEWRKLAPTIILKGNRPHLDLFRKYLGQHDEQEPNFSRDVFYNYLKLEFLLRTSSPEHAEEIRTLTQVVAHGLRNERLTTQMPSELRSCLAEIAQVVAPRLNQQCISTMQRDLRPPFVTVPHVHVRQSGDLEFLSLPCLPKALKKQLLDSQAQLQLEFAPISLPF
jgi:hypothetical protein